MPDIPKVDADRPDAGTSGASRPDAGPPEPNRPDAATGQSPEPIYAPEEIRPPVSEANSYGGGIDSADLPPTIPDDADGPGSAHDAEGWRAIETRP